MALTQAQYNAHVRQLTTQQLLARTSSGGSTIDVLIQAAIAYGRTGVDEREAALRYLREVYLTATGIDPTSSPAQRHEFKHWIERSMSGEGVEA